MKIANDTIQWDRVSQMRIIAKLENEKDIMEKLKGSMERKLRELEQNWDTDQSRKVINELDPFFKKDFGRLIEIVKDVVERLNEVCKIAEEME